MKLYWPICGADTDVVGYNHAIRLYRKALSEFIVGSPEGADYRVYCNRPLTQDPEPMKRDGLPLVAFTMYESSVLPGCMVRFLNKHFAFIVVPSSWCREMFLKSGVKKPVHVVSLGVDTEVVGPVYKYTLPESPYVFLWQGVAYDPNGRKGVDVVVRAFRELKREGKLRDQDELILKFRPRAKFSIDSVRSPVGIRYVQADLSREKLIDLYKDVDCCINPTHGEGFGLIPLEQMAMGKPVLLTGYSLPYTDTNACIPLNYRLKRSTLGFDFRHLAISKNGMSFNLGSKVRGFCWLPKRISKKKVGTYSSITPQGIVRKKVSFVQSMLARIVNTVSFFQVLIGFYYDPKRRAKKLYQEFPGYDAHVEVDHLKEKMMWCYNNRDTAYDMGFLAREHVIRNWSLLRIQDEFIEMSLKEDLCRRW